MTEFRDNDIEHYSDDDSEILPDKNGNYIWQCFVCGGIITQAEKPDYCPFCKKEETFFFKIKPQ